MIKIDKTPKFTSLRNSWLSLSNLIHILATNSKWTEWKYSFVSCRLNKRVTNLRPGASGCEKGFQRCFLRVWLAVDMYCSCRASKGTSRKQLIQGGASGRTVGWVDSELGSSPGWWAATVATYCPSRMVEHSKSKSIPTQPYDQMPHPVKPFQNLYWTCGEDYPFIWFSGHPHGPLRGYVLRPISIQEPIIVWYFKYYQISIFSPWVKKCVDDITTCVDNIYFKRNMFDFWRI